MENKLTKQTVLKTAIGPIQQMLALESMPSNPQDEIRKPRDARKPTEEDNAIEFADEI